MAHGDFTWIDLSTFEVEATKKFYRSCFQWEFDEDDSGYVNCSRSNSACAGLYEMPEFFQKIKMPSFWMTYISVTGIDAVVAKAKELGGKIEIEETNALGKVALIRDPAGAGFTCYEGSAESALSEDGQDGRWCGSELFVSDLSKVKDFYEGVFGWSLEAEEGQSERYLIRNEGKHIGAVQVASNEEKGDKEFWGVFFGVRNAEETLASIREAGGEVSYEHQNSSGTHYLVYDPQGAAFFVTEESGDAVGQSPHKSGLKWRILLGLIVIYLAVLCGD